MVSILDAQLCTSFGCAVSTGRSNAVFFVTSRDKKYGLKSLSTYWISCYHSCDFGQSATFRKNTLLQSSRLKTKNLFCPMILVIYCMTCSHPDYGGHIFLWNFEIFPNYMELKPVRQFCSLPITDIKLSRWQTVDANSVLVWLYVWIWAMLLIFRRCMLHPWRWRQFLSPK
jgi:hypothetical protein